jgi:hypothetical protein
VLLLETDKVKQHYTNLGKGTARGLQVAIPGFVLKNKDSIVKSWEAFDSTFAQERG